jgi:hypothetical protein
MRGLYVYGALSMALTFATGAILGNNFLMASGVLAAINAVAAEASHELANEFDGYWAAPFKIGGFLFAVASWSITAASAFMAFNILHGA